MKRTLTVFLVAFMIMASLAMAKPTQAIYQETSSVVIKSDGTVTPLSAPVSRDGDVYTLTDDIYIPASTNEGIRIEKDNITLEGAGHTIRGHGESSAIILIQRTGVTIRNVLLLNFYWGIELQNSTKCTVTNSNLTAVMYPIYLGKSSGNQFYHNNIYRIPHYTLGCENTWDNGYPSGGNYWNGYPYSDVKKGPNQDQNGSDGIGDVAVREEIFSQGGANVDRYPLMAKQTFQAGATTNLKIALLDTQGKAIQDATIESTTQPTGQSPLIGTTDINGEIVFNDVKPGSYTIKASKSGYPSASSTINTSTGVTTNLPLTFQSVQTAGTIVVTVKDKDGSAISGASVSSTTQPSGQTSLTGTTGADGVVTFSNVKPGSYTLQATKSGYAQNTGPVTIVSGETANLGITLQTTTSGGGTTTGGSGGVPGFPIEAIAAGIVLILVMRKTRWLIK
jgi:hypothetical protein